MDHLPTRRTWNCATCSQPWPCLHRRRQLSGQYADNIVSLSLLMAAALIEAMEDLPGTPAGELHTRFVGWIRQR